MPQYFNRLFNVFMEIYEYIINWAVRCVSHNLNFKCLSTAGVLHTIRDREYQWKGDDKANRGNSSAQVITHKFICGIGSGLGNMEIHC